MTYQYNAISALSEIPALVSAFAQSQGWTVDSSTPNAPIFTIPGIVGAIPFRLASTSSGVDRILSLTASGSSITSDSAQIKAPKLSPTNGTNPLVKAPTDLHLFVTPSTETLQSLAIVVGFGANLYRHLYLGALSKIGNYTGGEVISSQNGPEFAEARDIPFFDYAAVRNLFSSRSGLFAEGAHGGCRITHADNSNPWRAFDGYGAGDIASLPSDAILGGFTDGVNDGFLQNGNTRFSGRSILNTIQLFAVAGSAQSRSFIPVGYPPGIRMVNIANLNPAESISVGNKNWRVFPALSKRSQTVMPAGLGNWRQFESSFNLGYAYLEN